MNNKLSKIKCIAIFVAGISAASLSVTASAEWSITNLGTLGGSHTSRATGINNSGQVVGTSSIVGDTILHAFITGPNGAGMTDLGTLGGQTNATYIEAVGINDSGQVIGRSITLPYGPGDAYFHNFITGPNGVGMTDLDTFGGTYAAPNEVYAINNSGQVVGGGFRSFMTGPGGTGLTDLGTLGGSNSFATGINDSGQVVGGSSLAGNPSISGFGVAHAYITGPNGVDMTDLGTLGGIWSAAVDINNSGQVVGTSFIAGDTNSRHAFITGPDGMGMTDLGTLGGTWTNATGINNSGQVIGTSLIAGNVENHAFLYSNGIMIDLSLLAPVVSAGWFNLSVRDINDSGQIVGSGYQLGYAGERAFLLSPFPIPPFSIVDPPYVSSIPEPETYAMLLVGLGLLSFMALRKISRKL